MIQGIHFTREQIEKEISRLSPWYSSIELFPGVFTTGHKLRNTALTRELIRRCPIKNLNVLDIGAMEAVITVLLKRQGAQRVTAVDGDDRSRKMPLIKSVYQVDFDYFGRLALHNTVDFLWNRSCLEAVGGRKYSFGFDAVILSGVLYHVFSPLHVMAMARSCLREGGLMVIETAALNNPCYTMQYNFTGKNYLYDWTDTWFITLPLLDYFCRFLKMEILDCLHLEPTLAKNREIIRVGLVCRAINSFAPAAGEDLMVKSSFNYDYNTMVRDDLVNLESREPLPYNENESNVIRRSDIPSCDLYASVNAQKPLPVPEERMSLRLEDIY